MSYKKLFLLLCLGIFLSAERNANAQTQTFSYTGAIQSWTVPNCTYNITITAIGATGGIITGYTPLPGKGAKMSGTFTVTPGEVLKVLVGGAGGNSGTNGGGGGGGGSFVTDNSNNPLCIAGGGGGVCAITNVYTSVGIDAVTTTSGVNGYSALGGSPNNYGVGGTPGNGATNFAANNGPCGGNGAGLLTNGAFYSCCVTNVFGIAFINGGAGGLAGCGVGGVGGFGGGGGGGNTGGGGGGGYSGGGGAWNNPTNGGGGGSYNNGLNQSNVAAYNAGGNGSITITYTVSNIPVTCSGVVYQNENTCNGQIGIAYAVATGAPLSYSWTGGQTKDTATGLSAGSYTVTVSSPCGGSASAAVTITQPPNVVTASTVVNANVLCNGGFNGSATVTINGAGTPYTYTWSPVGGNGPTANGLTAGLYTVKVANVCGATASAQVTITQPNPLSITATTTSDIPCYGENNGTVLGKANSGTPPYTYAWAPSGGNLATAVGLAPGVYTVTLTDANGCTGSARTTVTQPAAALTTSITAVTNVLCNAGSTGSISSSTAGGTLPYTYSWTGGQTNAMANALTAGSYTLDITDANGCKVSAAATITQPTAVKVITDFTVDSGYCTGSAWVMVNGGVLPYTYLWSNGNTTDYINNVCGTTKYCCTITDAQGCTIDSECVIVDNVLGVGNVTAGAGKITVYPNPTTGQFTIQLSAFNTQWSVEVYNVLGEKVYSQSSIQNATSNINLGNQPNGVYLYRIVSSTNGNLVGEGKIVLEK